ncbi:ABC transporter permease subunit [Pedococcus bigeumensis]|uniref:Transporter n=1 Tax=Pedococcus bigeumensis TaxID=433644 RepID=A0A502CQX6_9MICO|nr:ABC transporter permease subunit [Pedococcus bigeumensis]TPG14930.1 transporter [Pedococcus bigeumensis]
MTWLTWRQFRTQAATLYLAVAAVAVVVLVTGPRLHDLAKSGANLFDNLTKSDQALFFAGVILVAAAPAIIGAFWGAPLVARELEHGTHRLVWNQSVTRTRWLATKLGLTTLGAAAAVGLLTWAVTWWSSPLDGTLSQSRGNLPGRLTPVSFAMRGLVPVGYAVFAVVLGATLGIILRRSLPAMAITLAVFAFVQVAVPLWVRPHLIAPATVTLTFSEKALDSISGSPSGGPDRIELNTANHGDWILTNRTVNAAGQATALPAWLGDCLPGPRQPAPSTPTTQQAPDITACLDRLNAEGYRQRIVYQPVDRFWPLQFAETGLFLVMSGLLGGLCFWWTRKRLS